MLHFRNGNSPLKRMEGALWWPYVSRFLTNFNVPIHIIALPGLTATTVLCLKNEIKFMNVNFKKTKLPCPLNRVNCQNFPTVLATSLADHYFFGWLWLHCLVQPLHFLPISSCVWPPFVFTSLAVNVYIVM